MLNQSKLQQKANAVCKSRDVLYDTYLTCHSQHGFKYYQMLYFDAVKNNNIKQDDRQTSNNFIS